jgi:Divergent InlB B-repeat domain
MLVLIVVLAGGVCAAAFAMERSPFEWGAPFLVAPATLTPGIATGYRLNAVSCGTPSMCVAVDGEGHAFSTTNPAGGGDAWRSNTAEPEEPLTSIACPASTLCLIGDNSGNIITSTDPMAETPTWTAGNPGAGPITAVACAGTSLCVAVDQSGIISTSTNPFGGAQDWRSVAVDPVAAPLTSVSCATTTLCVATDASGDILTSRNPTGNAGAWEISAVDEHALLQVSCPTVALCVALGGQGEILVSTQPAEGGHSWKHAGDLGGILPASLTCPSEARCVALGEGDAFVSDFPMGGSETWLSSTLSSHQNLSSISCPTTTQCVAVDSLGHAIVGSGPAPTGTLKLSLSGSGHGSVTGVGISCPGTCSATYTRGTPITLSATSAPGSTFSGWGGPCAGSAACTLSIGRVTELTATFGLAPVPPGFFVTVAIGGSGSVTAAKFVCPPECRVPLAVHQTISFTARPSSGWRFQSWSGACERSGLCRLTGDENKSLRALFAPGARPRIQITHIKVDRRHKTAAINVKTTPVNSLLLCALKRRGSSEASHYRRCRSRSVYRSLVRGAYVFDVRERSNPTVHTSRTFVVR